MVTFSPVILEPNQFFVIKLLVLHRRDAVPRVIPIGKIAGSTSEPRVTEPYKEGEEQSLFRSAFSGSVMVQVVRLIVYFIAATAIFIGLVGLLVWFDDRKGRRLRNKVVKKFRSDIGDAMTSELDVVLSLYRREEIRSVSLLMYLLSLSEKQLSSILKKYNSGLINSRSRKMLPAALLVKKLLDGKAIHKTDRGFAFDEKSKELIRKFIQHVLREKKHTNRVDGHLISG
jgi:hypothetical protein